MEAALRVEQQYRTLSLILLVGLLVLMMAVVLILLHGVLIPALSGGDSYFSPQTDEDDTEAGGKTTPLVILDAGHGGEDGGASSKSGLIEKDLNLAVTMKLGELLRVQGIRVIYTRTEDVSLNVENIRGKHKLYDLKNRLNIAKKHPDATLISIHMNTFGEPKYSGLQAFYSKNHPESKLLADAIQTGAKRLLQPENNRVVKKATSSIFLLDRASSPAVLVECGFLSNPDEAERLGDTDYQTQLALVIMQATVESLT